MLEGISHEVELLIRSRFPIIFLETREPERANAMLYQVASRLNLPLLTWSRSKGLREQSEKHIDEKTLSAKEALWELEQYQRQAVTLFHGLGDEFGDLLLVSKLRDAAAQYLLHPGSIIITGDVPEAIPSDLKPLMSVLALPLPSPRELQNLLLSIYTDLQTRKGVIMAMDSAELDQLVRHLSGLTLLEAKKILTKVMLQDGMLGKEDLGRVLDAKREALGQDGLLEYYPVEQKQPPQLAGAEVLLGWLKKRRAVLERPEEAQTFGLSFPKGLLLLGVQGTGKSLAAKAVAADWQLPLLRLDTGALYDKYVGESERNLRKTIATAEKLAPAVLWIDEIEKAFSHGNDLDGGVSQRVLATFLSWLQERQSQVFVVATANNIASLPAELMRKGRFDEIFFLDLPAAGARAEIFAVHLRKRQRNPEGFDLAALAAATAGFSGAEIEQVVICALYSAFDSRTDVSTQLLLQECQQTVPLALTMAEQVSALRTWAQGRAVNAASSAPITNSAATASNAP